MTEHRYEPVERLAEVARERRRELGLTQAQLAERAGVSRDWVIRMESGARTIRTRQLEVVLRVLDMQLVFRPKDAHGHDVFGGDIALM